MNMRTNTATLASLALFAATTLLLGTTPEAQAAILAQYDFDNYTTVGNRASNIIEPNSTPGSYSATTGLFSDSTDSHYISSNLVNPPASTLVEIGTFSVAADPGYIMNLDSLDYSFAWFDKGVGSTLSYAVFANGNQVFLDNTSAGSAVTGSSGANTSINLSGPAYQGISSVTISIRADADISAADVILRTVGSVSNVGGYTGGEDLQLNGSVQLIPPPVPEPSTAALCLIGCAIFRGRRLRRSHGKRNNRKG